MNAPDRTPAQLQADMEAARISFEAWRQSRLRSGLHVPTDHPLDDDYARQKYAELSHEHMGEE